MLPSNAELSGASVSFCWVASNPEVARACFVLVLPPCSQTISRAAALQTALKIRCYQWVWVLWKDSQGSWNTMYHHQCMTPAFIFFKPSSLGELLPPRYMLFLVFIAAWWSKMTASAGDELLASIIACILRLCHQWSMGSLAPAKCTAQAVCSAAHPNSASNIWIPVHVPWTGQEEEPLGETKAKNGEKMKRKVTKQEPRLA